MRDKSLLGLFLRHSVIGTDVLGGVGQLNSGVGGVPRTWLTDIADSCIVLHAPDHTTPVPLYSGGVRRQRVYRQDGGAALTVSLTNVDRRRRPSRSDATSSSSSWPCRKRAFTTSPTVVIDQTHATRGPVPRQNGFGCGAAK